MAWEGFIIILNTIAINVLCIERVADNAFSVYDWYCHAIAHKPLFGGHDIYNFARPIFGHYCILLTSSLFYLCLWIDKKIFKEMMHFHYMTYMATPYHKNICPGGHEMYNFGRPFLGHHYYIISLSDLCLGIENIFYEVLVHQFYTFFPQITFPWVGGGVMKFTISCLLTLKMLHSKFG